MASARKALRLIVLAGFAAVALMGCGGGGQSSANAAAATTSTSKPPDEAKLRTLLVQQSDLPAGWAPEDPGDNSALFERQSQIFDSCLGVPYTPGNTEPSAEVLYTMGDSEIDVTATYVGSDAAADADTAAIRNPKASQCTKQAFVQTYDPSVLKKIDVSTTPGAGGGPANVVATQHLVATGNFDGQRKVLYTDVAYITTGRIEAQAVFSNPGSSLPADFRSNLVAVVANRVARG
jgi:hypothetical protein